MLVYHVGKLRKDNAKFANDFNVILHAKEQQLDLITGDGETGRACKDNNVACILVDIETIFEKIILPELKTLESA